MVSDCRPAMGRQGNSPMMRPRSAALISVQLMFRTQPRHNLERTSCVQILTLGLSIMSVSVRYECTWDVEWYCGRFLQGWTSPSSAEERPPCDLALFLRGENGFARRRDRRCVLRHRRHRCYHAFGREGDDDLCADAKLRFQHESSTMQVDQALGDGQAESRALFSGLDRVGTLAEGS